MTAWNGRELPQIMRVYLKEWGAGTDVYLFFPFQSLSEKFERHSITFSENIGKTEPLVSTVVINLITYAYTDFSSSLHFLHPLTLSSHCQHTRC